MKRILLGLAALFAFAVTAHAAGIIVPAEQRYAPYSGVVPACDDPGVLGQISDRFAQKESEYWNSSLQIGSYDRVREIGFRANGLSYIPRRYCIARALDSNGKSRTVIYDIGEGLGMHRLRLGRRVVRRRPRPQPRLCASLQRAAALRHALSRRGGAARALLRRADARGELAMRRLIAFAALLRQHALLGATEPAAAQTPGDFDYYVFTLSWSPGFCDTGGAQKQPGQCASGAGAGFVVHGLWPDKRLWPQPGRLRREAQRCPPPRCG